MVTPPPLMQFTNPEVEMVASEGFALLQTPPGRESWRAVVCPTQATKVPVIAGGTVFDWMVLVTKQPVGMV